MNQARFAQSVALVLSALALGIGGLLVTASSVSAAPTTMMVFTVPPLGATASGAFTTQPTVTLENADGTTDTTDTSAVTLSITSGTGTSGAVLSSCSETTTAGIAQFSGCAINLAGHAYTLTATDGGITAVSGAFNVSGTPAMLVFSVQPSTITAGVPFLIQPQVNIEDAYGDTVTTDASAVSVAVTSGGTLSCLSTLSSAVAGVASFSGCTVDQAGTFTITATDSTDAITGTSGSFVVSAGAPTQLSFSTQPSNSVVGIAFGSAPTVTLTDAFGNAATTSAPISLAITSGTGTSGAALSCSATAQTPVNGVASFPNCAVETAGTGYTLTATDSTDALSSTSAAFSVAQGATTIALTTSPTGHGIVKNKTTFTATVAIGTGTGTLHGAVSFLDGTTPLNGCTNVAISGTTASCAAAFTQSKTYSINASYSNDPNFADSNTSLSYQVDKPEPGMRASGKVMGSSTILDVTLTGGLGKPTGKVVIKLGTRALCGATVVHAVASCHVPSAGLKAGRHRLDIRYGGNGSYASLTSNIVVSVR